MNLSEWLVAAFDDVTGRLHQQVLGLVPEERRGEHPGGGNSILWGSFHVARHAALALAVLSPTDEAVQGLFSAVPGAVPVGGGLQEAEETWGSLLAPADVDGYLNEVSGRSRELLVKLDGAALDAVPEVDAALRVAGVDPVEFSWLYRMWCDQPVAFFVRWPLIGHVGNHVGEMIATRNRMGLSPF